MDKAEAKRRVCLMAARRLRVELEFTRDRIAAYNLDFPDAPRRRLADAERFAEASEELAAELERRGTRRYKDESEDKHDS